MLFGQMYVYALLFLTQVRSDYLYASRFNDAACKKLILEHLYPPTCSPRGGSTFQKVKCASTTSAYLEIYSSSVCSGAPISSTAINVNSFTNLSMPASNWTCSEQLDAYGSKSYYKHYCGAGSSVAVSTTTNLLVPTDDTGHLIGQQFLSLKKCSDPSLNTTLPNSITAAPSGVCLFDPSYGTYSKLTCDSSNKAISGTYIDSACVTLAPTGGFPNPLTLPSGCSESSSLGAGLYLFYCNGKLPLPTPTLSASPTQTPTGTGTATPTRTTLPPGASPSRTPSSTPAPRVCGSITSLSQAKLQYPQVPTAAVVNGCPSTTIEGVLTTVDMEAGGMCVAHAAVCTKPADFCTTATTKVTCVGIFCPVSCNFEDLKGPFYVGCPVGMKEGTLSVFAGPATSTDVSKYIQLFNAGGTSVGSADSPFPGKDLTSSGASFMFCASKGPGSCAVTGGAAGNPLTVNSLLGCPSSYIPPAGSGGGGGGGTVTTPLPVGVSSSTTPMPSATPTRSVSVTTPLPVGVFSSTTPMPSATPTRSALFYSGAGLRTCGYYHDFLEAKVILPAVTTTAGTCPKTTVVNGVSSIGTVSREVGGMCRQVSGKCTKAYDAYPGVLPGTCAGLCLDDKQQL